MPRGSTAPPAGGNTAHPNIADVTHGYTFHAGATIVPWIGGVNGTFSVADSLITQSNTTGLTCTNQTRYVTLGSSIALSGSYSIMWRSKTTGAALNSIICSGTSSQYLQMSTGSDPDAIFFRDSVAFILLTNSDAQLTSLVDYCLTVTATTTKLYSKLAAETTWTLTDTETRTGSPITIASILDGSFSQSNVGELHYLQIFNIALTATHLLDFADPYLLSTPDETAPVVGTCSIPTAGTYITVPFTDDSLPILPSAIVGDGGFTVTSSGAAVTVANVLRTASNEFRLLLSRIIITGETITFSYAGSTVTDSASTPNELAAIVDQAVTNNSTQVPGEGALDSTVTVSGILTRPVGDDQPIIFSWPTPGATLSGTRAIGIAAPEAIPSERFIFAYTASGEDVHYLEYDAADRPVGAGTVVYRITDGTITRKIILSMLDLTLSFDSFSTGASVFSPVTLTGELNPIVIGDDYLDSIGRAFIFYIDPPTGYVLASSTCKFGGKSTLNGAQGWLVTGTITLSGALWKLSFDIGKAVTALLSGSYDWSVEVINASTFESTPVKSHPTPVQTIPKQTIS